jgi:glycosyltransferase involved in cell wall biosynthesis
MPDNTTFVSVAMATYNGERFLRKQLDSIYNQTYKNIEVVVGDDKSSDATVAILEEYKGRYGLRYFINEKRLGFIKNFEQVFTLCRGRFVALADQDDIWLPEKIDKLVNGIGEWSLIYSDASYIDENDTVFAPSIKRFTEAIFFTGKPLRKLLFNNCVTGCTVLFKRELLDSALPIPQDERSHDWWLALVACKSNGIFYIDEPLVLYRKHDGNTLGIYKPRGLFYRLFGFLIKRPEERRQERHDLELQEKMLKTLKEHRLFNDDEKQFLTTAHEYYFNRLYTKIHIKAFVISLTLGKYIFSRHFGFWRLKATLKTLIR